MRLLLVEDNRELSDWIARLLRKSSYVVDCVADGDDADAALATQIYDLVILDLGLPQSTALRTGTMPTPLSQPRSTISSFWTSACRK
jgi:DNA-binding response OmpR family regulator